MPQQRQRRSPPTHRWKTSFRCTNTLPTCATNKTSHTSSEAPRHPADSKWQLHGHRQHQSFRSTSFTTQRAHCVLIALTRGKCLLGSRRFLNLLYGTGLKKKKVRRCPFCRNVKSTVQLPPERWDHSARRALATTFGSRGGEAFKTVN